MTADEVYDLFTNKGKRQLTKDLAIAMIQHAKNLFNVPKIVKLFDPSEVIEAVNYVFKTEIRTNRKRGTEVRARQCAMTIIKNHSKLNYREIGELFPGRLTVVYEKRKPGVKDHTSVLNAIAKYNLVMEQEPEYAELYNKVLIKLNHEPYFKIDKPSPVKVIVPFGSTQSTRPKAEYSNARPYDF